MSCEPFKPVPDWFDNNCQWGPEVLPPWEVAVVKHEDGNWYFEVKNGGKKRSLPLTYSPNTPPPNTEWIFFPSGNYLAMRKRVNSTGSNDYEIYILNLNLDAPFKQLLYLGTNPWQVPSTKKIELHPSRDGLAFFIFVWDTLDNSSKLHMVFRSDTLDTLCAWGPIQTAHFAQRLAKITSDRKVEIITSPEKGGVTVHISCPLPSGKCVLPACCSFTEVIMDGPEEKMSQSISEIRNDGKDCLQIDEIRGVPPFAVISPQSFPLFVEPGRDTKCTLVFAPSVLGNSEAFLPIKLTATDPSSNTQLHCKGTARKSRATCEISGEKQVLDVVSGDPNTATGDYTIRNAGKDTLRVDAIQDSESFKIISLPPSEARLLGTNESLSVRVKFTPPTETWAFLLEEKLRVICTPPNGASEISCKGIARLPILKLIANPPASFTTHCFSRQIVTITLQNTGEVRLELEVVSPYPWYRCSAPGSIDVNATQQLSVEVWSEQLGDLSIPLTINGTFHLEVNDFKKDLKTSYEVTITGTITSMQPDALEPNDDFSTATPIDLPLPARLGSVGKSFPALSLHDCSGLDKDYFAISFQSHPEDDRPMMDGTTELSLGMVIEHHAPRLVVRTQTTPETTASENPFSRQLQIYKSDVYGRSPVATFEAETIIRCPALEFPDKRLYAVLSNPNFASQGPVEYAIEVAYSSYRGTVRCVSGVTKVQYIKLQEYYNRIWLVDPPRDVDGNPVDMATWVSGVSVVIHDLRSFAVNYQKYISQPGVLYALQNVLHISANAILTSDKSKIAQIAHVGRLPDEANQLNREQLNHAVKTHDK